MRVPEIPEIPVPEIPNSRFIRVIIVCLIITGCRNYIEDDGSNKLVQFTSDKNALLFAIKSYYIDKGSWPDNITDMYAKQVLVGDRYAFTAFTLHRIEHDGIRLEWSTHGPITTGSVCLRKTDADFETFKCP